MYMLKKKKHPNSGKQTAIETFRVRFGKRSGKTEPYNDSRAQPTPQPSRRNNQAVRAKRWVFKTVRGGIGFTPRIRV